jgi:hypothetical protein
MRVNLASNTCAACHVDVHRGTFKQDCKACHSENGFAKTPFDHGQTKFPLDGKHSPLACATCHKTVTLTAKSAARRVADFRGLRTTCVSCHTDVHTGELGNACESCHSSSTFSVTSYRHARFPEFFGGQHASVACGECHVAAPRMPAVARTSFKSASTTCVSCHTDVHLGQVGLECQSCHSVQSARFAVTGFSHTATIFPLTGKHAGVACSLCHKSASAAFPAGTGTAVRLKGVAVECRACHQDVHLGQVESRCENCHSADTFTIGSYKHRTNQPTDFFVGRHLRAKCASCHTPATGDFAGGRGTAMAFKIDARCTACHRDEHNGALPDCQRCHRP